MDSLTGLATKSASNGADDPAEIIALLLHTATRIRLKLGEFLNEFGMTEGRYAVLVALGAAGTDGMSQSDVAERLMHSESNVSALVDRLNHDGLVDRAWSTTDRRKRVLVLSSNGLELLNRIERARQSWSSRMLGSPPPQTRSSLIGLLNRLGVSINPRSAFTGTTESDAGTPLVMHPKKSLPAEMRGEPNSPHFALERMLSSLSLPSRLSEIPQ